MISGMSATRFTRHRLFKPALARTILFSTVATAAAVLASSAGRAQATPPAPQAIVPAPAPQILTPSTAKTPAIHGPELFGVRPGSPFLYTIPATGDRPITFSAVGLPHALKLDANTGQITGSLSQPGDHAVTLRATNRLGSATRAFNIRVGDEIALTPARIVYPQTVADTQSPEPFAGDRHLRLLDESRH